MNKNETTNIVNAIRNAFIGVPYPGDDQIVSIEPDAEPDEPLAVLEFFKGKTWADLNIGDLTMIQSALAFFTPTAFHHFLPAYMIAVLNHWEEIGVLSDHTISALSPDSDDSILNAFFNTRVGLMSSEQKDAVIRFLEACATKYSYKVPSVLEDALRFWKTG